MHLRPAPGFAMLRERLWAMGWPVAKRVAWPVACSIVCAVVCAVALAVLAGCGESGPAVADPDDDPGPTTGTLVGLLVKAEDGSPVGSLELSLLDLRSFAAVALVRADSLGNFVFEELDPGDYLPVVHSPDRVLFGLPRSRFSFTASETLSVVYPLAPIEGLRSSTLELTGQVIDAQTEEPVPFARIEMNSFDFGANPFESGPNWSEFRGSATTLEPTADAEGNFRLGPIPTVTFLNPETQELTEVIASWRVTAQGYRAAAFDSREAQRFQTTAVVRLDRGRDDGAIVGTVVSIDGEPRAGVRVHAEWRSAPGQFPKGDGLGRVMPAEPTAVADSLGRFRIESLPLGRYIVLAGAMGDDGWVGLSRSGIELTATSLEADAGALLAQPAIRILWPAPLEEVVGAATLTWEPFPGAVRYNVALRRAIDLAGTGFSVQGPAVDLSPFSEPFDQPSLFRWEVTAIDEFNREISATDRAQLFRYDPGGGAKSP